MFRFIYPTLCRRNGSNLLPVARFASGAAKTPPAPNGTPTKPPSSGASKGGSSCGSSPGPSKKPNPNWEKIKQAQIHFQKDDGKPIHLKGGSKDLMLYRITWGLAILGLVLQLHMFAMYILF
ncbi:cytochrome c oxidase subunit 7A-related protein, mitochondrial [Eurosta solidaginis]|uniref:cytochrome c oxidase subunit 7A-related protein, mitochondrial n=1 Tax=Eurosta solidaginis TaxID=178769 RepID=UPI0035316FA4